MAGENESIATTIYNYLNLYNSKNVDGLDKKVGAMLEEESSFIKEQSSVFISPYLNGSAVFYQAAAVLLHLAKLIKNIVLGVGSLILAVPALFFNWNIAGQFFMMAAGRAALVALNLTNALFAFAAVFVNAVASLVSKVDDTQRKSLEKIQENFNVKVHEGFTRFFNPSEKSSASQYGTTKQALETTANEIMSSFSFSK